MSWDADRIAGYLALHRPEGWRLVYADDNPSWLAGHPGGFGSADPASMGETIRFSPSRLAELLEGIRDSTVELVLSAVVAWWNWSMLHQAVQVPERDLPHRFALDYPGLTIAFGILAGRANVELADLLVY